jgi:molybdopterin synthase catalytic subunit
MSDYLLNGPVTADVIAARIGQLEGSKNTGGHSIFLGRVRGDIIDGREVIAIDYSAYQQMVDKEAEKIIGEIKSEFSDVISAEILHSVGIVKTGEISLYAMVSAGHRDHATRACRQLVELLKERLPVWKKELFSDESHRWTGNI